MQITGLLAKVERRHGEFTPDDAEIDPTTGQKTVRKYDFHLLHVFDGESMIECRVPDGIDASIFDAGTNVSFSVDVPKNIKFRINEVALLKALGDGTTSHLAAVGE